MPEDEVLQQLAQRLNNFEAQLAKVGEAIIQMARTEERVSNLLEQNNQLFKKMSRFQTQLNEVEKENVRQEQSLGFFERLGWAVFTAAVGLGAWFIRGG